MADQEQINEMASDMDYACTKRDLYPDDAKEIAKTLILLGYRKLDDHAIIALRKAKGIENKIRKETAEKFVNETIKRKQTLMNPYTDDESECVSTFWIYKLAKQFGVEIKE